METPLRIYEILKRKDVSLISLAKGIGKTAPNLWKSLQENPRLSLLKEIATYLGIEVSELIATSSKVYGYISVQIEDHEKVVTFDNGLDFRSALKSINDFIKINTPNEIRKYENGLNENIEVFENIKDILNSQDCTDENFMEILRDISISINSWKTEKDPVVTVYNLRKSLEGNPTLNKLKEVAEAIGVETKYLLSLNPHIKIQGIVNLEGEIQTIESINEFQELQGIAVSKFTRHSINENDLKNYVNSVLVTNNINDPYSENYNNNKRSFEDEDLNMSVESIIRADKDLCYSFRKKDDFRVKRTKNEEVNLILNFSNMLKYEMTLFGVPFNDSECCYIAGAYTNSGVDYQHIQQKLSKFTKGGYNAKGLFRKADNDYTKIIRQDFKEFNFEWMKLVIWAKIRTNPKGVFENMLSAVPVDAYIIEDTSYHRGKTAQVWGCKNKELTAKRMIKKAQVRHLLINKGANKTTINRAEQMVECSINNIGVWRGQNATGKALMICRKALADENLPYIDLDLLNSKNIYWNNHLIEIYIDEKNQYNFRNR